jgi:hypothetical protein
LKLTRRSVQSKTHSLPKLRFDKQRLTSYAGLVLVQQFFKKIRLREHVQKATACLKWPSSYTPTDIFQLLIIHVLLGGEWLSDISWYRHDPLVKRVLGLRRLPVTSTLTRAMRRFTPQAYERLKRHNRERVVQRLEGLGVRRVTVDVDGSVNSTRSRRTEGTAVGYNKARKGSRSEYPCFITIPQVGMVLDYLDRPGNVHDSNGVFDFLEEAVDELQVRLRGTILESRMDGAHFSEPMVSLLLCERVEFTISTPFRRFPKLSEHVQQRKKWKRIDKEWSYFELKTWAPKGWESGVDRRVRFVVYRQKRQKPLKGEIQLEFEEPVDPYFEYKIICTNKKGSAKSILLFHNGRGTQEGLFAELKSDTRAGRLPTRRKVANHVYRLATIMAHNLMRELQMELHPAQRRTTPKRAALWVFERVATIRKRLLLRAGRLTMPGNALTLTVSGDPRIEKEFRFILAQLAPSP